MLRGNICKLREVHSTVKIVNQILCAAVCFFAVKGMWKGHSYINLYFKWPQEVTIDTENTASVDLACHTDQ